MAFALRVPRRNKSEERSLAASRIRRLIDLAAAAQREGEPTERISRYVQLARKIGMRYQVSLPADVRRRVCRGCETVLVPGVSARHRTTGGRMSVTCLACGTIKRYPFRSSIKKVAA